MTLQLGGGGNGASGGGRRAHTVGNYRFTGRRLGKGNFAKVEEAMHTVLNFKVAIKIMDVSTIKEEYVVRNLYREAMIMSRLCHPCIASLFQTMQFGNVYYLVTELVGGGDLCNFIKAQRNGRLEEQCTRKYARQLISAISHMHNLGIVHRDLKMENVMLNITNEKIKIVDFGLSNLYSLENPLKTHCGSPEYAAPELFIEGHHYGPEIDLWSLGVILYGMVVGQLPFVSSSRDGGAATYQQRRKKLLDQINKGLATPHRKALSVFSPEFRSMMAKLLVADAAKRINITELIFHPWVTDKGRHSIRSNPLKKLDDHSQANILREIALLVDKNVEDIKHLLKAEPQGNISGIYNIITYSKMHSKLDYEAVTCRELTPHYATPRPITNKIKSPLKHHTLLRSAPMPKVARAEQTIMTPRRNSDTQTPLTRPKAARMSTRPLINTYEYGMNFVPLRRKLPINQKLSHSDESLLNHTQKNADKNSVALKKQISKQVVTAKAKESLHMVSPKFNGILKSPGGDAPSKTQKYDDLLYTMSIPAQNTRSKKIAMDEKVPTLDLPSIKKCSRVQSAHIVQNSITKSQSHTYCRPITTGPVHTAERAAKRRSMLPVTQTRRTPVVKNERFRSTPLDLKPQKSPGLKSEDIKKVTATVKCPNGMDFSNEPIARSIAGYVTRNVSNKIEAMKWTKGSKMNT